ncbi:MAG: glycosyltransferase [Leptolyngbyaceae cyanobacterium SM1_3_5]|nr:glycosyltransferase [Leptolyngbyaceae cyanobacterium SM1_3_5]
MPEVDTFTTLSIITATHDRAARLAATALPSIQQQTDPNFEWIIVNDGCDLNTRDWIANAQLPCSVRYLEMPHPNVGFGLCHARNLGLAAATADLVAYLDDDNAIAPDFVAATCRFFQQHPTLRCSMVQQWRRRDQVAGDRLIRSGTPFVAPTTAATVEDVLTQRELFDSNGFTHRRAFAPQWNPSHRIFADYEYFLQCLTCWGRSSFQLQAAVRVEYVQRSDGIIGRSSFQDWAIELEQILSHVEDYSVLEPAEICQLQAQVQRWQTAAARHRAIPAFAALPLDDKQ